jgi:hypothetical protein
MSASVTAGDEDVVFRLDGRPLVRCVGAAGPDIAAIATRLGIPATPTGTTADEAPPDLILRYVPVLPVTGMLRTVGRDDGAFTDDAFVVRRGGRAVALLPFDRLGEPAAEIVVVRGSGAPGRLVSLLNAAIVGRGSVALHGSAVLHEGVGVTACGWSGSGKTEVLLGFIGLGARYVGDEWLHTTPDGRVVGLPEPIRIQDWHVDQVPWLADRLGRRRITGMRVAAAGERGGRSLARAGRRLPGIRALGGAAGRLGDARRHVDRSPAALFGADALRPAAPIDRVFLLEPTTGETIRIEPVEPAWVADRMAVAQLHHRRELLGWYWQWRYAFPGRRSDLLEGIEARERSELARLFSGRPAFRVEHPHHVDIDALARAMAERL